MINTGGFQTNVIPNYTPVDPNLVAFNPGAITAGIGQSFDVAKGLAELKIMRQTHEENAKMSAAKNKLLQAQADNQRILTDYEASVAPKKTEAANLGFDAASAGSRNTIAVQPGITAAALRNQGYETLLAPGAFDLAQKAQDTARKTQPHLSNASIFNAKTAEGAAEFGLSQQGTTQAITAAENESKRSMIPDVTRANELNAKSAVVQAARVFNKTQSEYLNGTTTAEKLDEAKVLLTNAQTGLANATAKQMSEKNAITAARINNGEKLLAGINSQVIKLGNAAVTDPLGTGQRMKLSEISDRLYEVSPDGTSTPRSKSMFNSTIAALNVNDRRLLDLYIKLQKDSAELETEMMNSYRQQRKELTPTASTDDFGNPSEISSQTSTQPASSGTFFLENGKWVLRP